MRLAVTGAAGMLGRHVVATAGDHMKTGPFSRETSVGLLPLGHPHLDITDLDESAWGVLEDFEPDVIINCAGVVPQIGAERHEMVQVNAVGPHRLYSMTGARIIHVSTDCVFGGQRQWDVPHSEDARADPVDLYGRSKLCGEVDSQRVLNVRGSFVGWEGGLLQWLSRQRGEVDGWVNARWSGLYVGAYARALVALAELIASGRSLHGVIHLAGPEWTKFHLLDFIASVCDLPLEVRPVDEPRIHRELTSGRWRSQTKIPLPTWPEMLKEVRADYVRLYGAQPQPAATEDAKS